MSDNLPTVWPAEPHTLAKHAILTEYLQAWMPILANQSAKVGRRQAELRFVDGFAGPGIYEGNQPGSPVLALQTALEHKPFPVPVRFTFIEADKARWDSLNHELGYYHTRVQQSQNARLDPVRHGDCAKVLGETIDQCDTSGKPFGPAFVFLDQFGYTEVPMDLIARVMSKPQCEVMSYFGFKDCSRFISDPRKWAGIDAAYGGQEWRPAIDMSKEDREEFLHDTYKAALKSRANSEHVWTFAMSDENARLLYWLVFCTNSLHGLREMKRSMWKVDESGTFHFSDRVGMGQLQLLRTFDDDWLSGELRRKFAGVLKTIEEIREFVLVETPCYKWGTALQRLATLKKLHVVDPPPGYSHGFSTPGLKIQFEPKGLFEE